MLKPNASPATRFRFCSLTCLVGGLVLFVGCSQGEPKPAAFEPNMVHAMKYQIKDDVSYDQALQDANWVVDKMFGTPDEPKLPKVITDEEDYGDLVSLERLDQAAGPFAEGRGLYRQYCATCHGITGNGRGTTSAILNPYPRDYRMGVFKFKSTSRSAKPTRADMVHLIANGIDGTAMKKIPELKDDDVEALADYVVYLSIRGELERSLIDYASQDLDLESGDRVLDYQLFGWIKAEAKQRSAKGEVPEDYEAPEFAPEDLVIDNQEIDEDVFDDFRDIKEMAQWIVPGQTVAQELNDLKSLVTTYESKYKATPPVDMDDSDEDDADDKEAVPPTWSERAEEMLEQIDFCLESWEAAEDIVLDTADAWLEAEDEIIEVPEPPADIPVANSYAEFVELKNGDQADAMKKSIERGQKLFVGKIASCSKCHGEKGLGDGTTNDYDDWTKDWTTRVGLKPEDMDSLVPLLARGALPPLNAKPRNFAEGVFRGGAKAEDLYRRIVAGIAGSPMPAATFVEGQFEEDDVWHLINFIRSVQVAPVVDESTPAQPEPQQTAAK
ncbi:cytochrome c [Stieleria marina]|uniref:Cytochrome c n=1 Tax=Stieleria marina TaxID=1930275 RepID=A0A517NPS6_9BACT|nr:Cytochrome c [Planctomycetes bacterium K23_9]